MTKQFVAVAALLASSWFGYCQTITLTSLNTGASTTYDIGVINTNGNTSDFQLLNSDGNVAYNAQYKQNQNKFVVPGFIPGAANFPCTEGGYVNSNDTYVLTPDEDAIIALDVVGCEDQDGDDLCDDTVYITDTVYVTVTDTVYVTDTVTIENCTDEFTYYLNVITWLDSALTVVVNNLNDCNTEVDSLQNVIDTLEDELADCGNELAACDDIVDTLEDELAECETNLEDEQDENDLLTDINIHCDSTVTILTEDLLECQDEVQYWIDQYEASLEECDLLLNNANDIITDLENELSDCTDAVEWNAGLVNDLQDQLDECEETNQDLIDANYNILLQLEVCNATLDECEETNSDLVDAYNGVADDLIECQNEVDELTEVLVSKDCTDEYNAGFQDGLDACTPPDCAYHYGDVMEAFYNGYDLGLGDCDSEVTGIIDIDGNTVTQVVGYYNELGQAIDPRNHTGLIIRRHADGTFSKYMKSLR